MDNLGEFAYNNEMPPRKKATPKTNGRTSIDALIKSICDIMRRGNMAGALQYVPELSWLLFLRILDEVEITDEQRSKAAGASFSPSLSSPYRWRDWAGRSGKHRQKLTEAGGNALLDFVNKKMFPHLKSFAKKGGATDRQKVISQIFRGVEKTRFTTQRDMLDVLDKLDGLSSKSVDSTHVFPLSQVYENLLLKMGEKNNDGGQFFTPREVIRVMVQVVDPKVGDKVYDPCCGTGGFLAQAHEYMLENSKPSAKNIETLKTKTFYGREKDELIYPIALANLVLHGIDVPHIWHGNALTREEVDGTLYRDEEHTQFLDVVLTNPPFGGKESPAAQTRYDYKTAKTQVLFLQEVIAYLEKKGRCGIVVDEGLLFQTNDAACVKTKKRLLEKCDVWCIVSLPGGVFTQAGAGVKTNILFFTKGKPTSSVWYYDLSDVKVTKKKPLTAGHFTEFFRLLSKRADSENSWSVDIETIEKNNYDMKAVNPNRKPDIDTRTPAELLKSIREQQNNIAAALNELENIK